MNLNFVYSIKSELTRALETLQDKDFFEQYKYQVCLPKGITFETVDLDVVKKSVEGEFNPEVMEPKIAIIKKAWEEHKSTLNNYFESLGFPVPKKVTIILTKYGSGGSYDFPAIVICNVQNIHYDLFENIVHEITHIVIEEPVIEKFQLQQFEKEGVIEWLFVNHPVIKNIFPDYRVQSRAVLPGKELTRKIGWNF